MKRFYVEEDDNGKEIKRKLTTFANDDLTQLSDDELETLYYESSAQFLAKAMHFMKIENELFSRKSVTVSDEFLEQTGSNIFEAIKQVSNWVIKRRVIIFILTDADIQSIALIQQAHKKANNNFSDIVAQLYQQEFKTQEKAKYEHIKQAKEKALEEQRISEENQRRIEAEKQAESNRISREHDKATEQPNTERAQEVSGENENEGGVSNTATSDTIGSDWSSVSPELAANYMASKTGVSASKWLDVIYKESSGNPYVENELSCWGLLQIMQSVHGQVSQLSPQDYLDKAVSIYQGSGGTAWATW